MFDYLIIGGGAAGLCSAVAFAQKNPQKTVAVLEQGSRVGRKISVTGNGRCNITNRNVTPARYHSSTPAAAEKILNAVSEQTVTAFFANIGVPFCFEGEKAYPAGLQASAVTDALRFAAAGFGVKLFLNCRVTGLQRAQKTSQFTVTCHTENGEQTLQARAVLVATGGLAGGDRLGSTGEGYRLLQSLGHPITPCSPALVQVKTENTFTKPLKGIKLLCRVTAVQNGKPQAAEFGEVLFCDYGLSGPPVLQLSRYVTEQKNTALWLDLFANLTKDKLFSLFLNRAKHLAYLPTEGFFTGLLHKKVGQTLQRHCGIAFGQPCSALTAPQLQALTALSKQLPFLVRGSTGYRNAQITHGGAALLGFYPTALMSKTVPGLFAAGEVLDCDGDCGGFNLNWAWRTGLLTANFAARYLGEQA